MIESPPRFDVKEISRALKLRDRNDIKSSVSVINEEYGYWSEIKYKPLPEGISAEDLWSCVKLSRLFNYKVIYFGKYGFKLFVTDAMQRICHLFDMNLGGYMGTQSFIPNEDKNRYLVSSNMEEAIASSQMEGAATTRRVAKDMLRKSISPRNRSEQMILNNFETIRHILDHRDEKLTPERLLEIHKCMTEKTLSNSEDEGRFRTDNDVVVENGITGEVIHTPPAFDEIPILIDSLCRFFNEDDDDNFIHPIIKGCIIHFMIGFIHPFADGNGRTARAMFYWYMLNKGYWLTEYLSISSIISKTKSQYEKAYLYTEKDEGDLGYFIAYNLKVMEKSYNELRQYIQRKINEKSQTSDFIRLGDLNERQAQVLKWLDDDPTLTFTVKELQNRFDISDPTAREDLKGLVSKGFMAAIGVNKIKNSYVATADLREKIRSIKHRQASKTL